MAEGTSQGMIHRRKAVIKKKWFILFQKVTKNRQNKKKRGPTL
jgi:hypothetical protein